MYVVKTTIEQLASRGEQIRKLLRPIASRPDGPAWKPRALAAEYIIGTHDGSPTNTDHRSWRFATCVPRCRGMYFERWLRSDATDEWYLERAYLSIFQIVSVSTLEEREFICLHCDPNEPADARHARYKQGPHLHVMVAEQPLPKAHIALAYGQLDIVLKSIDDLTEATGWAINMIREEILDALP